MDRDLEIELLRWSRTEGRMPLLVRGARQVGKSYIVEKFGKKNFDNLLIVNFEQNPQYKECFKTLDPVKIVKSLELLYGEKITPGKTLLFLDEIQECPSAIMSLRYFKEQMGKLHVVGAGSLLEFAMDSPAFKMPVGRVEFLYLRPLSFGEFIDASGNRSLRHYLSEISVEDKIETAIHQKLLELVREYFAVGGMPAALSEYFGKKSTLRATQIQTNILTTFRNDFGKYSKKMANENLEAIFSKAPGLIGKWLKYSSLSADLALSTIKLALKKLCQANLITLIYATSGSGIPLISHVNEKKCKFLFLDIGLVQRASHLSIDLLLEEDLTLLRGGALAEQFVGQEWLAYFAKEEGNILFSWRREAKSSSAEVDYLVVIDGQIIPIEVKAGAQGKLKSMKIFLEEKKLPLGIRVSEAPLSFREKILSVPFYMIEQIPRLVRSLPLSKRGLEHRMASGFPPERKPKRVPRS